MASIKGFQLKNVKHPVGIEGHGCTGTMYLNGKKIGTYADYGDGASSSVSYDSEEFRKEMIQTMVAFAKEHPSHMIVAWFRNNPEKYKKEKDAFMKQYPYFSERDVTMEVLSACKEDFIVEEYLHLAECEKYFKYWQKKGYPAISVSDAASTGEMSITAYPEDWADEKILEAMKDDGHKTLYKSLDDFIL